MFDATAAAGFSGTFELRLGEDRFTAVVADGGFEASRGEAPGPDATIEAAPGTFVELVFGGRPLDDAERAGDVRVEGDTSSVERFLDLFSLPDPVEPAEPATVATPT
jgi:putative sterol carrier protein